MSLVIGIANILGPFHGVIKQKIELWPQDAWDNSIYVGPPSRELDTAWDRLQAGMWT